MSDKWLYLQKIFITMTVKDIFQLRKDGNIDEAWAAIQPMFAVHKGHYTSLAYFWLASDKLKVAIELKDKDTARHMLFAMTQAYPYIEDTDGRGRSAIIRGALKVDELIENFNLMYFLPYFEQMSDDDWKKMKVGDHWVPSQAERVLGRLFKGIEDRGDLDYVTKLVPLLGIALKHVPTNKTYLRCLARIYLLEGENEKAADVFRVIIREYKDPAAGHQLSALTKDPAERVGLLCQSILWQHQEKFRSKMRVDLAELLIDKRPANALYELQKSHATRVAMGNHVPKKALEMEQKLKNVTPATEDEEGDFYLRAINYLHLKAAKKE